MKPFAHGVSIAAAALGAVVVIVGTPAPSAGAAVPRYRNIDALVTLGGVWRSRGYGWIWSVEDGKVKTFDESGTLCLENSDVVYDVEDLNIRFDTNEDESQISVSLGDAAYKYTFDRIPELPEPCRREPASDPLSVFDAVVETIASHYVFLETRKIDWANLVASARSKITGDTTETQLYDVVRELLSHFHDAHVGLTATVGDRDFEYYPDDDGPAPEPVTTDATTETSLPGFWNYRIVGKLLGDTLHVAADGNITYGLIGSDIGYLGIASMEGYSHATLDRALDRALKSFESTKAVIVDVSMNDGGHDTVARSITSRFAADAAIGYFKYAGDSPGASSQAVYILPSARRRYTGPVYLMTSYATTSAGEVFVLAMRSLPNVTQIGERTNGSFSDVLSKALPNGWLLDLSNEIYLDSTGALREGAGVPPVIPLRMRPRRHASESDVDAARAVVEFIRNRHGEGD